ncbi:MAG: DUF1015 domain-containing protein [Desulfobacteraceae bacterium]|nr:MAG: DUF1015 domain-containing protein [Desulfobacteraceae bacterium]
MAEVQPLQGILYNIDTIKNISDVVTPPYDVISEKERDVFYKRHPNSIIRLDKGKPADTDTDADNPHTRAAAYFQTWLRDHVLIQDEEPAFYLTSLEFDVDGQAMARYGLIGRVNIEPFEKGIVLPHEKTFSKVKTERLALIKASHANFSQIFSIFSDESDIIGWLKNSVATMPPVYDFIDDTGHRHQLWRITDPTILRKVTGSFKEKKLFIADGHHRYETALNYKKWLIETGVDVSADHPASYTMMYLSAIQDPGLVILPTHRLVTRVPENSRADFLKAAAIYFDMEHFAFDSSDLTQTQKQFRQAMAATAGQNKIGVFMKDRPSYTILSLRPDMMNRTFGDEIDPLLKELDVTVLTRLILGTILEFTDAMLDDETVINFTSSDVKAITAITTGTHDMAFMLNPTTNRQVQGIAEKGLIMPRKSTYYFPKAISGLVMRSLHPGSNG